MKIKKLKILSIITMCLFFLVACSNTKDTQEDTSLENEQKEEVVIFEGLEEKEVEIPISDIMSMEPTEMEATSIKSSGEVVKNKIKGINLNEILEKYDTKTTDFTSIEAIAVDGYSSVVPKNIIDKKDILLIFEQDGKSLSEDELPFKLAIPDERAMYWVKSVNKIVLIENEKTQKDKSENISNIQFIEKLSLKESSISIENKDIKAYSLNQLNPNVDDKNQPTNVSIKAKDGLQKEVSMDIFKESYLTVDENEFTSETMKEGMTIKEVFYMVIDENAFVVLKNNPANSKNLDEFLKELKIESDIEVVQVNGKKEKIFKDNLENYEINMIDGNVRLLNKDTNISMEIIQMNI